jgi:transcriptional regulator with XRE-family HTH domain
MSDSDIEDRKERLRADLLDREYREQYATSTLIENVSAQVQALRRQRGLTQGQLAEAIGTKQPRVSNIEAPPDTPEAPNWEIDTLNRIARALGTRLEISFETYGSLVEELGSVTSDSLRRAEFESDPVLFPRPEMPTPDANAPERTRWMQELMIPWLCEEKLEIGRLIGWLQGRGLPAVGHDEEPHQWLLRGISVPYPAREFIEKRFAERLAVVLGEQPDVEPLVSSRNEDFLVNLYWTCAGLNRPSFLAEQIWQTYKRLKHTKLSGAVRDGLQGALVQNQFGEQKPLKEIWEPMIERGRHRWLRGDELVGYQGILVRHRTMIKPDLDRVLWALGRISHRWDAGRRDEFKRLMWKVPGLERMDVARKLIDSARDSDSGWSQWAQGLLPILGYTHSKDGSLGVSVRFNGIEFYASWAIDGSPHAGVRETGSDLLECPERSSLSGEPNRTILANLLLTHLSDSRAGAPSERSIAHASLFDYIVRLRSASQSATSPDAYIAGVENALIAAEVERELPQAA